MAKSDRLFSVVTAGIASFGSPNDNGCLRRCVIKLMRRIGGSSRPLARLRATAVVHRHYDAFAGRLRLASRVAPGLDPSKLPSESDIRLHIDRLERLNQEPEEMVGAAKELIEAVAKHVLIELGEPFDPNDDVASLVKQAMAKLRLHKSAIAPDTKGYEIVVKILGGLQQIAIGISELRNLGYGTGHGQGRRLAGVAKRHGELAARVAIAHALFVLDTLDDMDAAWRKSGAVAMTPSATIEPR